MTKTKLIDKLVVFLLGCLPAAHAASEVTAFTNVSLIPIYKDGIVANQTVIIESGRIREIGQTSDVLIPTEAKIINGDGKFLMPGLVDMHSHVMGDSFLGQLPKEEAENGLKDQKRILHTFVSQGVTTIRDMADIPSYDDNVILGLKKLIEKGEIFGPRIISATIPFDGSPQTLPTTQIFSSPEEAASNVEKYHNMGYDQIKIYSMLPKDQFDAVSEKAKELGIVIGGHMPQNLDFEYALSKGFKTVDHFTGFDLKLNESPRNPQAFANHMAGYEYATPSSLRSLVDMVAKYDVAIIPTFALRNFAVSRFDLEQNPTGTMEQRYQSDAFKAATKIEFWSPSFKAIFLATENIRFHLTKQLHDKGVPILAGTDAGIPGVIPGFSLLEEIELIHKAGLSNHEALKASTINGAKLFKMDDEFGSIREGLSADLLLLNSNPLEDISNIRDQAGVMIKGEWYEKTQLMTKLNQMYPE